MNVARDYSKFLVVVHTWRSVTYALTYLKLSKQITCHGLAPYSSNFRAADFSCE